MLLVILLSLSLINISQAGNSGRRSIEIGAEDVTYQLLPSRLDQLLDKSVYDVRLGPHYHRIKREGGTPSPPVPPQSSATNAPKSATTLPMQNTIPFTPTRRDVSATSTTQNGATHSRHSTTPSIQTSTRSNIITSKSSEITNPTMQESTTPSLSSVDSSNATSIVSKENTTSSTASTVMYTSNVTEVITEFETIQMPTMTPVPDNGTTTSVTTVNGTTTSVSCAGCNETSTASFNGSTIMTTRGTSAEVTTHGTTLVTVVVEDQHHDYYSSTFYKDGSDWYQNLADKQQHVKRLQISDHHLHATKIDLTFTFPFYGHDIESLYVATGGFLYLNSFFHQYISATQYIAPLMGNFHPGLYENATVSYVLNETSITVEWANVPIDHHEKEGGFTFQTTLRDDGMIIFAYKKIPLSVPDIVGGNNHKVTVGISDGFFIDTVNFFTVTRTIYTYHTVELEDSGIADNTAFVLTPLKSCNIAETCDECLNITSTTTFDCRWCDSSSLPSHRCSSGLDRHRQDWLDANCHVVGIEDSCPQPTSPSPTTARPKTTVGSGSSSKGKSSPAVTVEDMSSDDAKVTKSMQVTNSKGKEASKKPRPDGGSPPVTDDPNKDGSKTASQKPLVQPNRDRSSRRLSIAAIVVLVVLFIIVLIVIIVSGIIYVYRNPSYKRNVQIRELLIGANSKPDDLDAICETDC